MTKLNQQELEHCSGGARVFSVVHFGNPSMKRNQVAPVKNISIFDQIKL